MNEYMSNNWFLKYTDVVGYCRVSTGSAEQKSSFKAQQEYFESFVKKYNHGNVLDWQIDT